MILESIDYILRVEVIDNKHRGYDLFCFNALNSLIYNLTEYAQRKWHKMAPAELILVVS